MSLVSLRGSEPIAGYRVTERLGAGGYGEVWKVDLPGGLQKAIKFIYGYLSDEKASRELKALNRIKQIRHPFLLSLERIEVIDGQLLIVTELADASLKDRFAACKQDGLPAIPRDEFLAYMRDAADALDFLSENGLQHLDVKPENLLLIGKRVKVADFGLLKDIQERTCSMIGGMTPVYAPPEAFDGHPNSRSDQYSLAIVYQEMLTGMLPFPGTTAAQLASQHLYSRPRLEAIPASDREAIARALAKKPHERFPNSRALIDALLAEGHKPSNHIGAPSDPRIESSSSDTTSASGQDTGPIVPIRNRPSDVPHQRSAPARENRVAATSPRRSESVKPPQPVKSPIVDLPPLDVASQDAGIRPTLFLGLGGTAGHVLRRLRQQLCEQFGDLAAVPCLQTLLIDTDGGALARQSSSQGDGQLRPQDLVAMPLRKPQDYRSDSLGILQWLSRRWLYNIPRSLQTEGLRPLGRLALIDHADKFFHRVRDALLQVTAEANLAASQDKTGLPLRDRTPRVFVVASISGGTGSGMVLDVGYAVRMLLAELELSDDGLCAILTHSTSRLANHQDLAIANAYACLSELNHYSRNHYPGEPTCGLPAFDDDQSPFPHTYFVHMGNQLNDAEFSRAADPLAEYLFLDTATAGGAFFDRCRADGHASGPSQSVELRTLGVCQIGCSKSILDTATEVLCKSLVQRWIGDPQGSNTPKDPERDAQLERLISKLLLDLELNGPSLVTRFTAEMYAALKPSPESALQALARSWVDAEFASSRGELPTRWQRLTERARQSLGLVEGHPVGELSPLACLPSVLDAAYVQCADELGSRLAKEVLEVARLQDLRLAGAHQVCGRLVAEFNALENKLGFERQRLHEQCSEGPPDLGSRRGGRAAASERALDPAILTERLQAHFQLLFQQLAVAAARRLTRALLNRLQTTAESLVTLRREVVQIAGQFEVGEVWTAPPPARPAEKDVGRTVIQELQGRFSGLVAQLEQRVDREVLDPRGGQGGLMNQSAEEWRSLSSLLRSAARHEVTQALKKIDIAQIVLGPLTEAAASQESVNAFIERAKPRALECGGAQRLLLMMPEGETAARLPSLLAAARYATPTILQGSGCDLVACYEAERISLPSVAATLVCDDPQYAGAARRLHTRTDIDWCPL